MSDVVRLLWCRVAHGRYLIVHVRRTGRVAAWCYACGGYRR